MLDQALESPFTPPLYHAHKEKLLSVLRTHNMPESTLKILESKINAHPPSHPREHKYPQHTINQYVCLVKSIPVVIKTRNTEEFYRLLTFNRSLLETIYYSLGASFNSFSESAIKESQEGANLEPVNIHDVIHWTKNIISCDKHETPEWGVPAETFAHILDYAQTTGACLEEIRSLDGHARTFCYMDPSMHERFSSYICDVIEETLKKTQQAPCVEALKKIQEYWSEPYTQPGENQSAHYIRRIFSIWEDQISSHLDSEEAPLFLVKQESYDKSKTLASLSAHKVSEKIQQTLMKVINTKKISFDIDSENPALMIDTYAHHLKCFPQLPDVKTKIGALANSSELSTTLAGLEHVEEIILQIISHSASHKYGVHKIQEVMRLPRSAHKEQDFQEHITLAICWLRHADTWHESSLEYKLFSDNFFNVLMNCNITHVQHSDLKEMLNLMEKKTNPQEFKRRAAKYMVKMIENFKKKKPYIKKSDQLEKTLKIWQIRLKKENRIQKDSNTEDYFATLIAEKSSEKVANTIESQEIDSIAKETADYIAQLKKDAEAKVEAKIKQNFEAQQQVIVQEGCVEASGYSCQEKKMTLKKVTLRSPW